MRIKKVIAVFILTLFFVAVKAQKCDTALISDLLKTTLKLVNHPDSGLKLARSAADLSASCNYPYWLARSYFRIGASYDYLNEVDSALAYYIKYRDQAARIKDSSLLCEAINFIGSAYIYKADYPRAQSFLLQSLGMAERIHNTKVQSQCYGNMGNVMYFQNKGREAAIYWEKSLEVLRVRKDTTNLIIIAQNLSSFYRDNRELKKALQYLEESLGYVLKLNDKRSAIANYNNMGNIYSDMNNHLLSLEYYRKAEKLAYEMHDNVNLILEKNNIAASYILQKKYSEAENELKEGFEVEKRSFYPQGKIALNYTMYRLKNETGKYKEAIAYLNRYIQLRDSVLNEENQKEINELETKYKTEKKEQQNKLLTAQNILSEQTIRNQRYLSIGLGVGILLALFLIISVYRGYRRKQKDNLIILSQKDEVELRNKIIEEQKYIVEEKQKEVLDSITYARRIQHALLASAAVLKDNFKDHFIFFKPKDIVSGDFYWATRQGDDFYFIIADSTGHGVPGAFMSLLNISFLNEAINEKRLSSTLEILNYVRQRLITALREDGSEEGGKDGMDCVLMRFELKNSLLQFSSANNSLLLLRDSGLQKFSGDRMPVGRSPKENISFSEQTIEIKAGDRLYVSTDGYPDQFGGPKGKKLQAKQLHELIASLAHKDMQGQKETLERTLSQWKGKLEQLDDITVGGVLI